MRLNQLQGKMIQSKKYGKYEIHEAVTGVTRHTVLQQTLFL